MQIEDHCLWLSRSPSRIRVLHSMVQPVTAMQCAERTSLPLDSCKSALRRFAGRRLALCLNESARSSRVYALTRTGVRCQRRSREAASLPHVPYEHPELDWEHYGWVCFRHRSAVLLALGSPGSAALIKRRARERLPSIRISVGNVREVLHRFVNREIAQIQVSSEGRRLFSLTPKGEALRNQLQRLAEVAA